MLQSGYPGYADHKAEHERIRAGVDQTCSGSSRSVANRRWTGCG